MSPCRLQKWTSELAPIGWHTPTMAKNRASPSRLLTQMQTPGVRNFGPADSRYMVSLVPIAHGESAQASSFGIRFDEAQKPARSYSAETCGFLMREGVAEFIFGQRQLVGDCLDSALVMRLPKSALKQFLASIEHMEGMSLREIVEKEGIHALPLITLTENPRQLAKLTANVVHVSISVDEACLDFYQMSPVSVHFSPKNGKVELEPVARVDLLTAHLLSIIEAARAAQPVEDSVTGATDE